jgi:hypothetical protein
VKAREEAVQEVKWCQRNLYDHVVSESGVLNLENIVADALSKSKVYLSLLQFGEPNLGAISDEDIK